MKLIGTLRDCWRFWSVRTAAAQSATLIAWAAYPWPSPTSENVFKGLVFVANVLILVTRVVKQQPVDGATIMQQIQMPATQENPIPAKVVIVEAK